ALWLEQRARAAVRPFGAVTVLVRGSDPPGPRWPTASAGPGGRPPGTPSLLLRHRAVAVLGLAAALRVLGRSRSGRSGGLRHRDLCRRSVGGLSTVGEVRSVRARGTACRPRPAAPACPRAFRHGLRRRLAGRSALTPAASGASPAAAHIVPHHAAMCPARPPSTPSSGTGPAASVPSGDHEARSSKPVARGSARLAPK